MTLGAVGEGRVAVRVVIECFRSAPLAPDALTRFTRWGVCSSLPQFVGDAKIVRYSFPMPRHRQTSAPICEQFGSNRALDEPRSPFRRGTSATRVKSLCRGDVTHSRELRQLVALDSHWLAKCAQSNVIIRRRKSASLPAHPLFMGNNPQSAHTPTAEPPDTGARMPKVSLQVPGLTVL